MSQAMQPQALPYRRLPYFVHQVEDIRGAENLSSSGFTPLEFRSIGRRPIDLRIEGGLAGGLHLWTTRSTNGFVTVPIVDAALFSVRFVTNGNLTRRSAASDIVAHPGIGLLQAFDPMRREEASAGFGAITATMERASLAAHFHALEGGEIGILPEFEPVAETRLPGVRAFMYSLLAAHARLRAGAAPEHIASPLVQEIMIYQFLGSWPRRGPRLEAAPPPVAHSHRIRLALDYMEAHIAGRLRVSDIAETCGMSVRSLQLLFKRELGKSVVQTIVEYRLDRVHRDLLAEPDPGIHVGQVAYRWGFTHLSDFSRRYRERFGHLPSRTRRRSGFH